MSIGNKLDSNSTVGSEFVAHNNFLFAAGAIAVIAGLLFPFSAHIIDATIIFSISLTVAVLIITFSAQGVSEVSGFPLLILLAAMLRMALTVACSKLILSQDDAGVIIGLIGNIIIRNNTALSILIFGVLVVVIFGTICKAVKGTRQTASEFTTNILPLKQISIDSDLNAGVINKSQAIGLRGKVARETGFFVAMNGTARFILCGAVIELLAVVINIIGGMAIQTASRTSTELSSVKTYAVFAAGLGMIMQISTLVTAAASRYLVRKSSTPTARDSCSAKQEAVEKIRIVATQLPDNNAVGCGESVDGSTLSTTLKTGLLTINPERSRRIEYFDTELDEPVNSASETDAIAEEIIIDEGVNQSDDIWQICDSDDYYDSIASLIEDKLVDSSKTILMAAESVEQLPVTVPVNIAVRLAQKGRKCLLIDLDSQRNAVAKVFDIDMTNPALKTQTEIVASGINNLWVLPAENSSKNIGERIAGIKGQYDCLIVYAPNAGTMTSNDREQIAGLAQAAMFFGPEDKSKSSSIDNLRKLLNNRGCEIFNPMEVFAEPCVF